jgi:hypothetical protein
VGVKVRVGVAEGMGESVLARGKFAVGVASGVVTPSVGVVSRGRVGVKLGVGIGVGGGTKKEHPHKSKTTRMLVRVPSECITF